MDAFEMIEQIDLAAEETGLEYDELTDQEQAVLYFINKSFKSDARYRSLMMIVNLFFTKIFMEGTAKEKGTKFVEFLEKEIKGGEV